MNEQLFIFVGSCEQLSCLINVHYNSEEHSILEEILEYSILGFIDDEQMIYNEFLINDWQTEIVERYTEFIIKRIELLKG